MHIIENIPSSQRGLVKTISHMWCWGSELQFLVLLAIFYVSHSVLIPAPMGVGCLPASWLRILRCYLQYLRTSHFNIQVFVYHGKWSSNFLPKWSSECLPEITHVSENGFFWCLHPLASCSKKALSLTPLWTTRSVSWALLNCRDGGNLIP
jgi:hypothetical protein